MRLASALLLCASLLFNSLPPAFAQQPANQEPYRLRVDRKLVLVDVVVRARNGEPVPDLTESDFVLTEDGKRQEVAFFSRDHAAGKPAEGVAPAPLVVLLDAINTNFQDRAYSREALSQILDRLQPGQQVAIYGLNRELVLLHNFSSDRESLLKAMQLHRPSPGTPQAEIKSTEALDRVAEMDSSFAPNLATILDGLRRFEANIDSDVLQFRADLTAQALRSIARTLRGIPGRKSLLWFSGSFPAFLDSRAGPVRTDPALRAAANDLNDAQVSVYPIHAGGVQTQAAPGGLSRPPATRRTPEGLREEFDRLRSDVGDRDTMKNLAERTGGLAFFNRNDLTVAYDAALNDGAAYYNLGYYPSNDRWNGAFRRIRVNVSRSGVNLRHRQGYHAVDPAERFSPEATDRDMRDALLFNPSTLNEIAFDARVLPGSGGPLQVEFTVRGASFDYEMLAHKKTGSLEFGAVLLRADGRPVGSAGESIQFGVEPSQLTPELQVQHLIRVNPAPGQARLRVAVRDPDTGRIGTRDISLP
jgi:VWFA-related protein